MTPHSGWGWVQGHLAGRLVDRQGQLELKILKILGLVLRFWHCFQEKKLGADVDR